MFLKPIEIEMNGGVEMPRSTKISDLTKLLGKRKEKAEKKSRFILFK